MKRSVWLFSEPISATILWFNVTCDWPTTAAATAHTVWVGLLAVQYGHCVQPDASNELFYGEPYYLKPYPSVASPTLSVSRQGSVVSMRSPDVRVPVLLKVTKVATARPLPDNPYHSRPRPEPNPVIEGKLEPAKHGSRLFFWNWWGSSSLPPKSCALSKNSKTTCDHWHIDETAKALNLSGADTSIEDVCFGTFYRSHVWELVLHRAHVPTVSSSAIPPASSNVWERKDGLCEQSPSIHTFLTTSVNVTCEQTQHAVIIVVKKIKRDKLWVWI